MADYIPKHGARLLTWAQSFASGVAKDPAGYGLATADVTALSRAVEDYAQAYARVRGTGSRSRADFVTKDAAREALIAVVRKYARIIKASPLVDRVARVELGLGRSPANASSARVSAPGTRPIIYIVNAQPLRHFLRFANVGTESDGEEQAVRRPASAVGLQLFCHVGNAEPKDPLDARFVRLISRKSHIVEFKAEQRGQTAFYYARWQTAKGDTGPWSQVALMTVAG